MTPDKSINSLLRLDSQNFGLSAVIEALTSASGRIKSYNKTDPKQI